MSVGGQHRVTSAVGLGLGVVGATMVVVGVTARRDVRRTLARERITATGDMRQPGVAVRSPRDARDLAEVIRRATVASTGGRTYSETPQYVDAGGEPTGDAGDAARDERTGRPLSNPGYDLWIRSTTLQSALMQAYLGFRVAEFTAAVGGAFALAGVGIAFAGRNER